MSWLRAIKGNIVCAKCGAEDARRGVFQKYCRACGPHEERRRKAEWARTHDPAPKDKRDIWVAARKLRMKATGSGVSASLAKGESLLPKCASGGRFIRFSMAFTGHLSKNAISVLMIRSGKPGMAVRKEVSECRDSIGWLVKEALGGTEWPKGKTWLDIVVQKPNHRFDAVNVIDTLCDGIKGGLGLDDRWFAIGLLDWEIVKEGGKVFVQIRSDHADHRSVCSHCGQIKRLDQFSGASYRSLGVSGTCLDCTNTTQGARP